MSYDKLHFDMQFPPDALPVVPSNAADLPKLGGRVYVGGAGDVRVTTVGGTDVTFTSFPAGAILPVRVKKVWATSTTATNMVQLYNKNDTQPA